MKICTPRYQRLLTTSIVRSEGNAYETKPSSSLTRDDTRLVLCARRRCSCCSSGGLWRQYEYGWIQHSSKHDHNDKRQWVWRWQIRQRRNDADSQQFRGRHQDGDRHGEWHVGDHSDQCPGLDLLLPDLRCAAVERL